MVIEKGSVVVVVVGLLSKRLFSCLFGWGRTGPAQPSTALARPVRSASLANAKANANDDDAAAGAGAVAVAVADDDADDNDNNGPSE